MWTLDTCVEPTPTGRAFITARREQSASKPALRCDGCRDTIRPAARNETGREFILCDRCAEDMRRSHEEADRPQRRAVLLNSIGAYAL